MDKQTIIDTGKKFNLELVTERYAQEQNLSLEHAQEHERELKLFLILCALHPEKRYGMKGPIDKYWHVFLMFTRQYDDFCTSIAGRFLHHIPANPSDPRENGENKRGMTNEAYRRFLEDYVTELKVDPPVHLWPRPLDYEADRYKGATSAATDEDVCNVTCEGNGMCSVPDCTNN